MIAASYIPSPLGYPARDESSAPVGHPDRSEDVARGSTPPSAHRTGDVPTGLTASRVDSQETVTPASVLRESDRVDQPVR